MLTQQMVMGLYLQYIMSSLIAKFASQVRGISMHNTALTTQKTFYK